MVNLVACKGAPVEPEISVCTPEFAYGADNQIDYAHSQVFCLSDIHPGDASKQYRIPFDEYMSAKPIMTTVEDFSAKSKWGADLRKWGDKNCK